MAAISPSEIDSAICGTLTIIGSLSEAVGPSAAGAELEAGAGASSPDAAAASPEGAGIKPVNVTMAFSLNQAKATGLTFP